MKAIVVSEPGSLFHLGLMRGEDETSCYPWLYLWTGEDFLHFTSVTCKTSRVVNSTRNSKMHLTYKWKHTVNLPYFMLSRETERKRFDIMWEKDLMLF